MVIHDIHGGMHTLVEWLTISGCWPPPPHRQQQEAAQSRQRGSSVARDELCVIEVLLPRQDAVVAAPASRLFCRDGHGWWLALHATEKKHSLVTFQMEAAPERCVCLCVSCTVVRW